MPSAAEISSVRYPKANSEQIKRRSLRERGESAGALREKILKYLTSSAFESPLALEPHFEFHLKVRFQAVRSIAVRLIRKFVCISIANLVEQFSLRSVVNHKPRSACKSWKKF